MILILILIQIVLVIENAVVISTRHSYC